MKGNSYMDKTGEVYQISTMSSLLNGVYDGALTYDQIKEHGDFGIGTFDHLDGELIAFDGKFYRLRGGEAIPLGSEDSTPFSTITYFNPQKKYKIDEPMTKKSFETLVKDLIPSENLYYAILIEGTFKKVSTRTVSYQEHYVPMVQAVKEQESIEFENTKGTIVGFWTPAYAQGIAVAGYHFHFIDESLQKGGHVFDYIIDKATVYIDQKTHMNLYTPTTKAFLNAQLSRKDLLKEINITEG